MDYEKYKGNTPENNRIEVDRLIGEIQSNHAWMKEVLEEHGAKIDNLSEYVHGINKTVHNGLKDRQHDMVNRLAEVETALKKVALKDDLVTHESREKEINNLRWEDSRHSKSEKYKLIATLLTLASVVGLYIRIGFFA